MRVEEEAIMKQVMAESMKDAPKSAEAIKTANPEEEEHKEASDLVVKPNKSADQALKQETTQAIADSIQATLEEPLALTQDQLLQSISEKCGELRQQYLAEGNFVYELYAIMIHSGSAFGGHYYAYIKDIETGHWYNFNDSSVRSISVIDLVDMFGPEPATGKKGIAAKRIAGAHSANAYMLMYRIIDPNEDLADLQVQQEEIPADVLLDVKSTEVKQKEVQLVQDKKSQLMQLKVIYYPAGWKSDSDLETRVFYVDRREDTYLTMFDKVYTEFIGDHPDKAKSNFRLRAYNVQFRIMLDTYTGRENDSLEVLKIYPMKTLALEEKSTDAVFEEYDVNQMVVKVNIWRLEIQSLAEDVLKPTQIKVHKDTLMKEFIATVSQLTGIQQEHLLVLKRNPMLNTKCMELLSDEPEKRLNQLRINEGVNLFIEDSSVPIPDCLNLFNSDDFEIVNPVNPVDSVKPTKWEKEFELENNRF
jgi:Ubiquitin carboxyl-terminal hydrolase